MFAKQDQDTTEFLYEEEAFYRRVAINDAFVAQLQTVFATGVEAGVLIGNLDIQPYVYRDLKVGT